MQEYSPNNAEGEDIISHSEIIYVFPCLLGGVYNFNLNLASQLGERGWRQSAILTANAAGRSPTGDAVFPVCSALRFPYEYPGENLYSIMRRLAKVITAGTGILIANDSLELATVAYRGTNRKVVFLLHGDYPHYYNLAVERQDVIDVFITYTGKIHKSLCELLPNRAQDIVFLPYGIPIPKKQRASNAGPLRLLFVGRLETDKGVFDLPVIDTCLSNAGVPVRWTIHGTGPAEAKLKDEWKPKSPIEWSSRRPLGEVLALYQRHDVLVSPSRAEGMPLVLLEAQAAGVVPVISDLESGVREVVTPGQTGFRIATGDCQGFASAIAVLHRDRRLLERMSAAARQLICAQHDVRLRSKDYAKLFCNLQQSRARRPRKPPGKYGSRLDQPWLPNKIVLMLRRMHLTIGNRNLAK